MIENLRNRKGIYQYHLFLPNLALVAVTMTLFSFLKKKKELYRVCVIHGIKLLSYDFNEPCGVKISKRFTKNSSFNKLRGLQCATYQS